METIYFDANGYPQSTCMVSLYNPEHVSVLLTYYNQLKQESWEDLRSDMHWLLIDLDNLIARTLKDKPILRDLLDWKIAGYTNDEIQIFMNSKYGIQHTNQYFFYFVAQSYSKNDCRRSSKALSNLVLYS